MFSLATPIACMTVGMARHDEEMREDEVEEEEKERRGRNSRLGGEGGLKCNSEDDQTWVEAAAGEGDEDTISKG